MTCCVVAFQFTSKPRDSKTPRAGTKTLSKMFSGLMLFGKVTGDAFMVTWIGVACNMGGDISIVRSDVSMRVSSFCGVILVAPLQVRSLW